MTLRHRSRFSFMQALFPLKSLLHRLSVVFMILGAILIIFLSKTHPEASSNLRANLSDATISFQNFISKPFAFIPYMKGKISDMVNIYAENRKLKEENEWLRKSRDLANVVASENQNLRKFLNFAPEPNVSYITGHIAGESVGPYIKSAFFTEGSDKGVKKGQVVINDEGLVGRIIEVGDSSSRILLITDINSRVPVITGESHELAIAAGGGGLKLQLIYLPEDTKIKAGEEIYTSGDGEFFPAGILVGYIDSVADKMASVRPVVDWGRLSYVSVVDYQAKKQ